MATLPSLQDEIRLLEMLKDFRPVGPSRHFYLAGLLEAYGRAETNFNRVAVWDLMQRLFNIKKLNELHYIQLVSYTIYVSSIVISISTDR
jgi:hypothetical protein